MDRYNLQKLRDLPIEGVAGRLGLQVRMHKALCPFHDDHHASLSFKVSRNTFRCFVCGASGGTIDLVMRCLNKPFREACQWLADEAAVDIATNCHTAMTAKERPPFDASRYARFFEHPWLLPEARRFLFDERRLDPRVVGWCRLTSYRDRNGMPWLSIPYYDCEGRLTGVQQRNLSMSLPAPPALRREDGGEAGVAGGEAVPRFRFPSGSACGIYNLPVLQRLRPGDSLYIAEGCSDCWSLLSAGHKAIAIPSATLLRQKDAELLLALAARLSTRFHMYPDSDAPGERLFLQLREKLPALEHHWLPDGCKDYSEYYVATMHARPPDAAP